MKTKTKTPTDRTRAYYWQAEADACAGDGFDRDQYQRYADYYRKRAGQRDGKRRGK